MPYLEDLVDFCCQIVKVLHSDKLALHKPQLTIAFSDCLLCSAFAVQEIHCKLGWQVDLHILHKVKSTLPVCTNLYCFAVKA